MADGTDGMSTGTGTSATGADRSSPTAGAEETSTEIGVDGMSGATGTDGTSAATGVDGACTWTGDDGTSTARAPAAPTLANEIADATPKTAQTLTGIARPDRISCPPLSNGTKKGYP